MLEIRENLCHDEEQQKVKERAGLGRKKRSSLFDSYPIVEGTQLQSKKDKMSIQ
jgi:hypothetical protein